MELFFTGPARLPDGGTVAGISEPALARLLARRLVPDGMPVLLDSAMRPVEPLSSWFRHLALLGRSPKTMRKYAYIVLRLQDFLIGRGSDVVSASESDLLEYRLLRTQVQTTPVTRVTWEAEATAISGLYAWLASEQRVPARPWRQLGGRDSYRNSIPRDMRIPHMTLEQYLYFRDVGLGGLRPNATVDPSFRGRSAHRSRAGVELALVTGMRLGEWSTVLLPELGLDPLHPRPRLAGVTFRLVACAKYQRPREVYVPRAAVDTAYSYLRVERAHVVAAAQRTLKKRRGDLFVVDAHQDGDDRLRGVLDGVRVRYTIADMPAGLRRVTVMDTGAGLEPLALFVGAGGWMPHPSTWDKVRWRAWARMRAHAGHPDAAPLPSLPWLYHDLRHTFALRLLMLLMRKAVGGVADKKVRAATLIDHVAYNPLLEVQRRLGHSDPSTTYVYLRYLKDPMQDVEEAFAAWTERDGEYPEIAHDVMQLPGGRRNAP
ncbi:site-specific integrase [Nocardia gipuzkoensis]|uniref:site-specific integrase n=1 Tax=Nocardia gipuzkoensis TaxID=2749991 RepID=UPI00237DCC41|nr:site-specific integrase [Nocardia gipuzkoensis]MDE1674877.1 site-specific integrase [Nocardia gipuzkoensis]